MRKHRLRTDFNMAGTAARYVAINRMSIPVQVGDFIDAFDYDGLSVCARVVAVRPGSRGYQVVEFDAPIAAFREHDTGTNAEYAVTLEV